MSRSMPNTGRETAGREVGDEGRETAPLIDVACGVLIDAAGRLLIAQRPLGKVAAGKWEFPGGKIGPGETAAAALARELDEELGVLVVVAEPLVRLRQDYSDRRVRLETWRVTAFDGVPQPREGQQLAWIRPQDAETYDLLPSCWRVLAALRLPRHYVFTPPTAPLTEWLPRLHRLPAAALLRLRRPTLDDATYGIEAQQLAAACRKLELGLIVDRDPAQVELLDAAGWHANSAALARLQGRPLPQQRWCLASTHDAQQLAQARRAGMDAAVLAPVQPTRSHPGTAALGWPRFGTLTGSAGLPVYALGGLGPDDLPNARDHGAIGVAGISAYWSSSSPSDGASSAGMA